mmetsp:Transcript_15622/g.31665  ORF Transcript_15622/g.31665 Transcript_15622/m.31665 type:complete len:203 (-) Transcript_15622:270-878(-)
MSYIKMGICVVGATAATGYGLFWAGAGAVGTALYNEVDKEIVEAIRNLNFGEMIEDLWNSADADGNGFLDDEEIVALITNIVDQISENITKKMNENARTAEHAVRAQQFMKEVKAQLNDETKRKILVSEIITGFDANMDGKISKDEFKAACMHIPKIFRSFVKGIYYSFMGFVGGMIVCTGCSALGCTMAFWSAFWGPSKKD